MSRTYTPVELAGVNPIAAMPFTQDGKVDTLSFIRLIEHLKTTGCHGITLFGIASEFYKLTEKEKEQLATVFVQLLAESDVYSCISVTDHSTEVAVERARYYQALGANCLMLLPPFFLKPTTEQIVHHICSVLESVSIPVLVQYAPGETGLDIPPSEMAEISRRFPHAVFKIECNPPVEYCEELLTLKSDVVILNGYAGLYMMDMLDIGGKGVMPGCSFTEIYVEIYRLYQEGKSEKAKVLHAVLLEYIQRWMSHCEYIIAIEKDILKQRGIIETDYCRLPAYKIDDDAEGITGFIETFGDYLK
ncbi:dihydrodipicolinate synthase family protein [Enterovibrio sp. ZSDZ35]|uniref:Dihydrodipicolinate synthase family protein n=1 Tax=Enterovibrio qingdaonensis TaxID=2899818 RepID=A0ABT5QQZ1_9GAMM|nr:dihydrodipicolinate synthase family protein [Enterovibrio sp. ZSDZ35]MDD1783396.1 dihydrodipicolinate synthase family protein [Enterovibrio sp. ZSDZ35]